MLLPGELTYYFLAGKAWKKTDGMLTGGDQGECIKGAFTGLRGPEAGAAPGAAASRRSHHLPKLWVQEQLQEPGRAAVAKLAGASNPQRPRREEARE